MLQIKYARVCVILLILAVVFAILCPILSNASSNIIFLIISACMTVVCLFTATIIRLSKLKCPSCGKTLASLRWSQEYFCPKCGKPMTYDK
jgi:predicted RNA-binding Zn-ribbon protein involved in translation (DUF1610 family)